MRLRDIYVICELQLDTVGELRPEPIKDNVTKRVIRYEIDYEKTEQCLNILSGVEFIRSDIEQMYKAIPVIQRGNNRINLSESEYTKFERFRVSVFNKMSVVKDLYRSIFPDTEIGTSEYQGLQIKLPPFSNLDELDSHIKSLKTIFKIPTITKVKDVEVKCTTTDIGSFWLIIQIAGATAAVGTAIERIAAAVKSVIDIRGLHIDNQIKQESLVTQKEKNKLLKTINDLHEQLINAKAGELLEDAALSTDNDEDYGTMKNGLSSLYEMMDKGMEIYSLIDNPKQTTDLFPEESPSHKRLAESLIKYLPGYIEGNEEE